MARRYEGFIVGEKGPPNDQTENRPLYIEETAIDHLYLLMIDSA
jgi:hypothetical protein